MAADHFATKRLVLGNWRPIIEDMAQRRSLEQALSTLLTPPVLQHLPTPLWLDQLHEHVSDWITKRAAECDVLLVTRQETMDLVGLMFLASDLQSPDCPTCHIGYLLGEDAWGQGFATEMVSGLVLASQCEAPLRLVAGVDRKNAASARVLQKAGFEVDKGLSTPETEIYACMIT